MARREPGQGQDSTRREFFRVFTREAVQNAGAVAGAASELRRASLAAARGLIEIDELAPAAPATPLIPAIAAPIDTPVEANFRSAYRFTGDTIVILDQRELPGRVITAELREPVDVASALRLGAVTPGPVCGQIAAYGVAMAGTHAKEASPESRDQQVHAAADAIRASRGEVHSVRSAIKRITERYDALANERANGTDIEVGLKAEADAIATESTAACSQIARAWSELFVGDHVSIVAHGDAGPLACGLVGMLTSGVRSLIDAGKQVHVWLTEAAPTNEGTRISALQLTQLDIAHTVIPDSAAAWLFASRQLDAAVLRGDTVAESGETVAMLGSLTVAQLAADAGVPVHVLAPESSWDRSRPDLGELRLDLRSAAELGSASRARLNPPFDIVPARLITTHISEMGVA